MSKPLTHGSDLKLAITEHLQRHSRVVFDPAELGLKASAVAVVVTAKDNGEASFLLCRRAARMNSHARQWALPGGRMDPGETHGQAALRETHEELGIQLDESAVLGLLDDYPTRSGYVITPVVLWGEADMPMKLSPAEVESVHHIGLHELQRPDSPRFIEIDESDRPVVQVPVREVLIHAPTGAVLLQFRWVCLDGEIDKRVHEFEQPVFAWK